MIHISSDNFEFESDFYLNIKFQSSLFQYCRHTIISKIDS